MRKIPSILFLLVTLMSQQFSLAQKSESPIQIIKYDSRVFNACANEWVHLTGNVKYNLKERTTDKKYSITYQINFQSVKGTGETSGLAYSGGGSILGTVNASIDTSVNGSRRVTGSDIYKVRYNAPGGHALIYTQNAHFTMNNDGAMKVEFNDASDSCK